jgi:hypothetical protein
MAHSIDEIQLQRLVDGLLDDEQRRAFLVAVDRTPELWREVALAFVEEQVLHAELANLGYAAPQCAGAVADLPAPARSVRPRWGLLAVALGWLLMLGLGFQWGQRFAIRQEPSAPERIVQQRTADDGQPQVDQHSVDNAPSQRAGLDEPRPTYRLMLAHQDGKPVELPVFEQAELDDMLPWEPVDRRLIRQLNETLIQRGYRADMETEYLSGRLEDGRQIVVPWRTVSLQYDAQ